VKVIQVLNETV